MGEVDSINIVRNGFLWSNVVLEKEVTFSTNLKFQMCYKLQDKTPLTIVWRNTRCICFLLCSLTGYRAKHHSWLYDDDGGRLPAILFWATKFVRAVVLPWTLRVWNSAPLMDTQRYYHHPAREILAFLQFGKIVFHNINHLRQIP